MPQDMRLDRYLSEGLGISRSEAKAQLARGAVTVDGVLCRRGDTRLTPGQTVCAAGRPVARQEFIYLMLDKPQGVVSASEDGRDKTVVDLVGSAFPRRSLFPAGRLDKDSTGFILLTDDGAFAHFLLAPKRHVAKTYLVGLDTPLSPAMQEGFAAGVTLADGSRMQPAEVSPVSEDGLLTRVVLHQGVYHQIKRMFGVFDAGVVSLRRVAIGALPLDKTLGPGGWRELTTEEKALLTQDPRP